MKYLPALLIGLALPIVLAFIFTFMTSYSLLTGYFTSIPDLNGNSSQWWWLVIHDSSIVICTALALLLLYHRWLDRAPFNANAVVVMQLPLTVVTLIGFIQSDYFFGNTFQNAITVNRLLSSSIIVLLYAGYKLSLRRSRAS